MLLAQDPKLLLVDEPVAGMTDAETVETARLLKDIDQMHSVIVVEHDMHFVRELGVKVTCLHEGRCCRKARSISFRPTTASSKSIWGADDVLAGAVRQLFGPSSCRSNTAGSRLRER